MATVEKETITPEVAICGALGLNPNEVTSLVIRFVAGNIAVVDAGFIPSSEHLKGIVGTLKRFKLVSAD